MAELAAALAALSGGKVESSSTSPTLTPAPISPSAVAQPGWFVPPHLLRLPHCRASAFTAHDCSREAAAHPDDFDRVYRYGLSLQELASKLGQQPADQLALLHQAAEVYMEASRLKEGQHAAALYNWAVALTDIARLVRAQQPDEAYECLTAAAQKYGQSLAVHSDNPQANNNLGLVLQDLASLRPPSERGPYLRHSLRKFRRAMRLRPDFDRACYNMGTVLYSHACSMQEALLAEQEHEGLATAGATEAGVAFKERASSMGGHALQASALSNGHGVAHEQQIQSSFAHAAQYIALAYAMQPTKQVYADSLAAVQRLLPLPHLRAGPLQAVHPDTEDTPAERWVLCWFGLNHEALAAVRPPAAYSSGSAGAAMHGGVIPAMPPPVAYPLTEVLDARLAADPSLPAGAAVWVSLRSKPRGVYLVAVDQDEAEGWVDALLLAAHLAQSGSATSLAAALAVR